ncbi:LysR family transcriptional regulator [Aureimonas sp. AU12]|uniref:LysR family transcriptional regulator n=1 Tax=Aureimonas sp. AU12 TaxID=1638161 RepID=UPI0009EC29FE|nr:LysR family transcriptional regulator [Aureimonas sp. AU12]
MARPLTLRQIEVIRAVMIAGTIQGAAKLMNVSAPGVSRLLKYTEDTVGIRLFERKGGVFLPAAEASMIFGVVERVHREIGNLNEAVALLRSGDNSILSFASAPSIAQFIAARVIRSLRQTFPNLSIDLNVLKIEETADYLLLERGEFVIMSSPSANPALVSRPLAQGRLVVIVPEGHELANRDVISIHELAREAVIGVDPEDPYGAILARPFVDAGLTPRYSMRGRFAQTVVSLVRHGLGVALIDEFSVAEVYMPGLVQRPLVEPSVIIPYALTKRGRVLSSFAEDAIERFRSELLQSSGANTELHNEIVPE